MTRRTTCRHGLRAFERNGHLIHAHDGSPCLPVPRVPPPEPFVAAAPPPAPQAAPSAPPEPAPAPPEPAPAPPEPAPAASQPVPPPEPTLPRRSEHVTAPPFTPAAPTRVPLAYETALATDAPSVPSRPPRAPRRNRVGLVVGAVVGALVLLGAGLGAGVLARSGAVDEQETRAVAAERQAASLKEQLNNTAATIDEQQSQIDRYEQQQSDLRQREQQLDRERDALQPTGADATSFGDGLFQAEVAIQPGQYHTDGTDACYWAKLSTGDTNSIIENDFTTGPQTVTIDSPYFESENCGTWTKIA